MNDRVRIENGVLAAEIDPLGAELVRLQDEAGRDLMWDGNPAIWNGHAPILFPVVGAVSGGVIRVDGREYPLARHGFARRRPFALVDQSATEVTFRLVSDAESRSIYPFDFRLDLHFQLEGSALTCAAQLHNPGDAPLPASLGYHPAFLWPLPWGGTRAEHRIVFEQPEPAAIRRIDADGLILATTEPTPLEGSNLTLRDSLFETDALIFDEIESRRVHYGVPGGRQLEVRFDDMPMLGIWTKPGAGYVCIEPWQGMADPAGYDGEFRTKPGVITVAPGAAHQFTMRIDIAAAEDPAASTSRQSGEK
jgi:galactose mutarotase-like enzyme